MDGISFMKTKMASHWISLHISELLFAFGWSGYATLVRNELSHRFLAWIYASRVHGIYKGRE